MNSYIQTHGHRPFSNTIKRNQLWIIDLSERVKTVQLLEETKFLCTCELRLLEDFLEMTLNRRSLKEQMTNWTSPIKNICSSKTPLRTWKDRLRLGGNICKSDKGLIYRICKEFLQLNKNKQNNSIKKWAGDLNKHFTKEHIQTANMHMKRCLASSAIRKRKLKSQWDTTPHNEL